MKILLCDKNPAITRAWESAFADIIERKDALVKIYNGDFKDIPNNFTDGHFILCTAGNSYGIMGGGLDLAIARYFPGLEQQVRDKIKETSLGELLVGDSRMFPLEDKYLPFYAVVYAPTMRAPININGTENVYLATLGVIRCFTNVQKKTSIFDELTLILPGFGGGCGRVRAGVIASSMRLAYDIAMHPKTIPQNEAETYSRHALIQNVSKGIRAWP